MSRSGDFNSARNNIMGKDAKVEAKGKTRAAKRVKSGNCSAEDQEVKEFFFFIIACARFRRRIFVYKLH